MKTTILAIFTALAVVAFCHAAHQVEVKPRDKVSVNVYYKTKTTAGQYLIKAWPELKEDKSKIVLNITILRNKNRISRHLEPVTFHWVVDKRLTDGTDLNLHDPEVYEIKKHPDVLLDRGDIKTISEFNK